jgi:transcriptional regulator with XRE-family HTH domain
VPNERDRILRSFGAALAAYRFEKEMTQEELAETSGLHRTYIGAVERGIRNPTIVSIVSLARGLGVDTAELVRQADL